MPSINIENAQLKTASIEIKALTVNGRQLTLSIFRQIPEEDLINYETMTLNGIPWGVINYFWKDNGNEYTHIHIIWQKGKELKRCVNPKAYVDTRWFKEASGNLRELKRDMSIYLDKEFNNYGSYEYIDFNRKNLKKLQEIINSCEGMLKNEKYGLFGSKERTEKELNEAIILLDDAKTCYQEILKIFNEDKEYAAEFSEKLKLLHNSLNELPQLFIAI